MSKTITNQLRSAINMRTFFGQKKRIDKAQPNGKELAMSKIYSIKYKDSLESQAKQFGAWMANRHPEIRMVKDITSSHIEEFMEENMKNWTPQSYNRTRAQFSKLSAIVNAAYSLKTDYASGIKSMNTKGSKRRCLAITRDHLNQILSHCNTSLTDSCYGIRMQSAFGLRTSESVNIRFQDIYLNEGKLVIYKSKGGRTRELPITTEEQTIICKEYLRLAAERGKRPDEKILNLQPESQDRWLSRKFKALGLNDYLNANTSGHAIRKRYATDMYINEYTKRHGTSPDRINNVLAYDEESWNPVSAFLGHGKGRYDLFNAYVV